MALTVIGREPLEELAQYVTELFSDAVNKHVEVPKYETSPYRKEDMGVSFHARPFSQLLFKLVGYFECVKIIHHD